MERRKEIARLEHVQSCVTINKQTKNKKEKKTTTKKQISFSLKNLSITSEKDEDNVFKNL